MTDAMKKIDRRLLFSSAMAAAMFAASGSGLSATPKRGGTLRAALSGLRDHDDWHQGHSPFIQAARGAVFETLTQINADGILTGDIAKNWHPQDAGRRWVFELSEDVVFHDGLPLHRRDITALFARHRELDVKTIKGPKAGRIEITLHQANANFPYLLADTKYALLPAEPMRLAKGIGSGLYRVHAFQAGRHFTGIRLPDHRKEGLGGWFEKVHITALASEQMRKEALRDALVDVVDSGALDAYCDPCEYQMLPHAQKAKLIARNSIGMPQGHFEQIRSDGWPQHYSKMSTHWWLV